MEVGRIKRYSEVTEKWIEMGSVAPEASEEDMVLFITDMMATKRAKHFLYWEC